MSAPGKRARGQRSGALAVFLFVYVNDKNMSDCGSDVMFEMKGSWLLEQLEHPLFQFSVFPETSSELVIKPLHVQFNFISVQTTHTPRVGGGDGSEADFCPHLGHKGSE